MEQRTTTYALVGRVKIKPGHEDEARAMVSQRGIPMLEGMAGSVGAYWSRAIDGEEVVQHSLWLFDSEENARAAEAVFNTLRGMPDAPAVFISADVCEVIGQM